MYQEHTPSAQLTPYVEAYWTVSGEQPQTIPLRILPDGCVDIIMTLNPSPYLQLSPYRPALVGTITSYLDCTIMEGNEMVGIRFRPAGFTAFCRIPLHEFTDLQVDLPRIDTLFDERFCADLPLMKSATEVVRHIDSYLLSRLSTLFVPERQIVHAVRMIRQSNGLLPPEAVASECCLSLRHFERKFKSVVGISPKTFSRITKFQHTHDYMLRHAESPLFEIAIDCGYYDKAHLIKECKAFTGNTPSELR